jgi:hypothetical protein
MSDPVRFTSVKGLPGEGITVTLEIEVPGGTARLTIPIKSDESPDTEHQDRYLQALQTIEQSLAAYVASGPNLNP